MGPTEDANRIVRIARATSHRVGCQVNELDTNYRGTIKGQTRPTEDVTRLVGIARSSDAWNLTKRCKEARNLAKNLAKMQRGKECKESRYGREMAIDQQEASQRYVEVMLVTYKFQHSFTRRLAMCAMKSSLSCSMAFDIL
jgi:hypothetical protein